jgi:hypothetical protein
LIIIIPPLLHIIDDRPLIYTIALKRQNIMALSVFKFEISSLTGVGLVTE